MKLRPALTLVEILLVLSIVALLSIGALYSFSSSRQNQALKLSADNLSNQLQRAHIFARESRDDKSWGIRIRDEINYVLVSRDGVSETENFSYQLLQPVTFTGNAGYIWFDQGTGYIAGESLIQIENAKGDTKTISISQLGVISVQ